MIRFAGTMILAAIISWFGIIASRSLYKRVSELKQSVLMIEKLKSLLLYQKAPTNRLIEELCETEEFRDILFLKECNTILKEKSDFKYAWKTSICNASDKMHLDKSDLKIISDVGSILGASDATTQAQQLMLTSKFLSENMNSASDDYNLKGKLYRSLGIFAGIGTAIVLI